MIMYGTLITNPFIVDQEDNISWSIHLFPSWTIHLFQPLFLLTPPPLYYYTNNTLELGNWLVTNASTTGGYKNPNLTWTSINNNISQNQPFVSLTPFPAYMSSSSNGPISAGCCNEIFNDVQGNIYMQWANISSSTAVGLANS